MQAVTQVHPSVRLVGQIKPELIEQLQGRGLFRCCVLVPNCTEAPVTEVLGRDGIRRLCCQRHTSVFCEHYGISEPIYPADLIED